MSEAASTKKRIHSLEGNNSDSDASSAHGGVSTSSPPTKKIGTTCFNSNDNEKSDSACDNNATMTARLDNNSSSSSNDNNDNINNSNDDDDDRTSKDYYFDSYSHHGIHEEMLKDEVRTKTYQLAIQNNKHLFENKIILDVGCGTGILSMFAVQAGAKHVYAVDCSSIIHHAKQIVRDNNMSEQITLIQGKMEDIDLHSLYGITKVDVIISEWMGYFLLYESMLNTVIVARDKWLTPNGIVFPDKAVMYLCAVEDEAMKYERIDFWDNVYGFDMSAIKHVAVKEPVVDIVNPQFVVTNSVPILNIDLQHCTEEELSFISPFRLTAHRADTIHCFVAYFECAFTQRVHQPLGFSTSPFAKYTHWKQTIFYLSDPIALCMGEEIIGTISCKPNRKNVRDLDIALIISLDGQLTKMSNKHFDYRLR